MSAGILVACAAAGFLAYHLAAPARPGLYPATGLAPRMPEPRPAPLVIPAQVPGITLVDLEGKPRSLDAWKGQPLVINFWAPWCGPCRREVPLLRNLARKWAPSGFQVIGIALDLPQPVQKYVRENGIAYPVLVGDHGGFEATRAFGMEPVLPFTVFADRSGRIITVKIGELRRTEADGILAQVHDLDEGRVDLATARSRIAANEKTARSQQ